MRKKINIVFALVLFLGSVCPCISKEFDKADFVRNINKYSDVHKTCVIMEYFPCDEYFSSTENNDLKKVDQENIGQFLMKFGYSLMINKKESIIIGLKSYEKVQDVPDVSFDEIQNSFSKMKYILSDVYMGNSTGQTREKEIDDLLMYAGINFADFYKKQMPIAALNSNAKSKLYNFFADKYFERDLDTIWRMNRFLSVLSSENKFGFQFFNLLGSDIKIFGFNGDFIVDSNILEFGLSHNFRFNFGGANYYSLNGQPDIIISYLSDLRLGDSVNRDFLSKFADIKDDFKILKIKDDSSAISGVKSIQDICDELNKGQETKYYTCDKGVARKKVFIAGLNYAKNDAVFRAVAEIYGLSLRRLEGQKKMTYPTMIKPTGLNDFGNSIAQIFPAPLVRRFAGLKKVTEEQVTESLRKTEDELPGSEERSASQQAFWIKSKLEAIEKIENRNAEFYKFIVGCLRSRLEEKVKKSQNRVLYYSLCEDEDKRDIALLLLCDAYLRISKSITQPVPEPLLNFDNAYLTPLPGRGKPGGFVIGMPNGQGGWRGLPMMLSVNSRSF